mmetsp:Transcript_24807/g.28672  ORF Transcript_24807/g.28672 Transcript_24807/m.28672 type:complete len:494 (-) Transcript_24807:229-1710(-)
MSKQVLLNKCILILVFCVSTFQIVWFSNYVETTKSMTDFFNKFKNSRVSSISNSNIHKIQSSLDWLGRISDEVLAKLSHPHLGAKHPNGTLGMIVNPSPSRLHPLDLTNMNVDNPSLYMINKKILCHPKAKNNHQIDTNKDEEEWGIEGEGGNKILQKVKLGLENSQEFIKTQRETFTSTVEKKSAPFVGKKCRNDKLGPGKPRAKPSRILCMVYAVHLPPEYENSNLRAVAGTWGQKCDGFFAGSNYTDHSVGSINLVHQGKEDYGNMWQKVRSMWSYAYDHFKEEYDFFHISGDDVYLAVDNLRAYVDGPEMNLIENGYCDRFTKDTVFNYNPRPVILGRPYYRSAPGDKAKLVISGGPGYTLNRAALEVLVEQGFPTLFQDLEDPREDIYIASTFYRKGIWITDTDDALGQRRYGESAETEWKFKGNGPHNPEIVSKKFGSKNLHGIDGISEQFISFHLKDDKGMLEDQGLTITDQIYRYHTFLYGGCDD